MMIAFVHCWIGEGGGLSVLRDLIAEYEDSQKIIFTLYSDREYIEVHGQKIPIITVLPKKINDSLVFGKKWRAFRDPRNLMPLYPLLLRILSYIMRKYTYKSVVISSFAVAKNIIVRQDIPTRLYLHSPNQYIWSHYDEYMQKLPLRKKTMYWPVTRYLRLRDAQKRTFTETQYNSEFTKEQAHLLYPKNKTGQESIDYPKISRFFLSQGVSQTTRNYFVFVGRIVRLVREVDRIIDLFRENGEQLIIIGDGPDKDSLVSQAPANVVFVGHISDEEEKRSIISQSRGMVNLSYESFGIATCEALLCGVPLFGYNAGGTKELVGPESGVLVESKEKKILVAGFNDFRQRKFDKNSIRERILEKLQQ